MSLKEKCLVAKLRSLQNQSESSLRGRGGVCSQFLFFYSLYLLLWATAQPKDFIVLHHHPRLFFSGGPLQLERHPVPAGPVPPLRWRVVADRWKASPVAPGPPHVLPFPRKLRFASAFFEKKLPVIKSEEGTSNWKGFLCIVRHTDTTRLPFVWCPSVPPRRAWFMAWQL